jgi:predicted transcriptional regulator
MIHLPLFQNFGSMRYDERMAMDLNATELRDVFRQNVRARRLKLGLTQTDLAEKLSVRQPLIAQIEAGTSGPTLDSIARIAAALDVAPSELLEAHASVVD